MIEYLRFKDFVLLHGVSNKIVTTEGFDKYSAGTFRKMVPFNGFMNDV